MNSYEEKVQAKKERYAELARKNAQKATAQSEAGWDALKQIPFGQPILIGHHSERSDRAYRNRATGMIDRSIETSLKADYYEQKAKSVGTGGISSDDPDAIQKLKNKLALIESNREQIKAEFKRARSAGEKADAWRLKNLGATIRSTKQRIEQLEAKQAVKTLPDVLGKGWRLHEDKEINRILFFFEIIPGEDIRQSLKYHGFRWSPTNRAWQAFLTNRGRYQAQQVIKILIEKLA